MRFVILLVAVTAFSGGGCSSKSGSAASSTILGAVVFETQVELFGGVGEVSGVALADVTGDSALDVSVIDRMGSVQVSAGQAGGVFVPAATVPVSADGVDIRAADIDLDGDLDLCVASFRNDVVNVLRNDGAGGFVAMPDIATSPVPTSMVVQDCNDDEIPDLLLTHFSESFVAVFLGNGDGSFGAEIPLTSANAGNTAGLTVADVTGDGNTDILVCDMERDQVVIFPGDSQGLHDSTAIVPVGDGPFDVAVGDLTGDGVPEIAVTNFDGRSVQVLSRAPGVADFAVLQELAVDGVPGYCAIGDVTGDGANDVVVSMVSSRAIQVFEGDSSAAPDAPLGAETRLGTTGSPHRPILGDVDGDGRNDVLVAGVGTAAINLFLSRAGRLVGARHHRTPLRSPAIVDVADFDGDGVEELVAGGLGEALVAIMERADDTEVRERLTVSVADASQVVNRTVHDVLTADIDKDGKPDVLVAVDGGIKLCHNVSPEDGPIAFDVRPADSTLAPGDEPRVLATGDVTGNGEVDLIVAFDSDSRLDIVPGLGGGLFGPPLRHAVPSGPGGLAVADFDGDERDEVAVSLRNRALVRILDVDAGRITVLTEQPVGDLPTRLDAADFNGDGRSDLVVSNGVSDSVTMLIATANGGFTANEVPAGDAPTALLTGDLNRDGFVDVLVATLKGSDFRVLLGDGRGGIGQGLVFPGTFTANTAALIDWDGTGLSDLVIGAFETQRLVVYENVSR